MDNFTTKRKIVILIIAMLITFTVGSKILLNGDKGEIEIDENAIFLDDLEPESEFEIDPEKIEDLQADEDELPSHVVVHITGEVAKPGVVTLENGGRVIDAIKKAGGLLSSADENNINLAQKLFDEDKINIPRVGDDLEVDDETLISSQGISNPIQQNPSNSASVGVNINMASKEELKTLPGIGDVTADKIIDYRETTKFSSVEDIKNVSGIGEKKFEAIQSMITIK